jgi:hypothetical protein
MFLLFLLSSTYNKQWSEANNALVDLLEFEIPKEDRKQDKVCFVEHFKAELFSM